MNQHACNDCETGPRELDGHGNLELHVPTSGQGGQQKAAFKCRACGYEWLRTYIGSGVFAWNRFVV